MVDYVYCEHSSVDHVANRLTRKSSSDEKITTENYADNNDKVYQYLEFVGEDIARAFTCPVCRDMDSKDATVYFLYGDSLETNQNFARLRRKNDGMFYRDRIKSSLSEDSLCAISHPV